MCRKIRCDEEIKFFKTKQGLSGTEGVFSSKKMQNAKYQLFWNGGMQNAKIFRVMFSSNQNVKFIVS